MNRRLRFSRKSSANRTEAFHKFLKPGALAQMRDSRISARSYRINSLSQIQLHRTASPPSSPIPSADQPQIHMIDDITCLSGRVYGPLCLRRKKLAAIKSAWLPISSMQTPTSDLNRDPIIDVLNSDVAAH